MIGGAGTTTRLILSGVLSTSIAGLALANGSPARRQSKDRDPKRSAADSAADLDRPPCCGCAAWDGTWAPTGGSGCTASPYAKGSTGGHNMWCWTNTQFAGACSASWRGTCEGCDLGCTRWDDGFVGPDPDCVESRPACTTTCGCTPAMTCAALGLTCGSFTDDCGTLQLCGPCPDGGGLDGGVTDGPSDDGPADADDGSADDGPPEDGSAVDGGVDAGVADSGTCIPAVTCASMGYSCGSFTDECGNPQDCGQCGPPDGGVSPDAGSPNDEPWIMWGDRAACNLPPAGGMPKQTYFSIVPYPDIPQEPTAPSASGTASGLKQDLEPNVERLGDDLSFWYFVASSSNDEIQRRVYFTQDDAGNLSCLFALTPACDPPVPGPRTFSLVIGDAAAPSCPRSGP